MFEKFEKIVQFGLGAGVMTLMLTACGGVSAGGGEGVEYGASKEEFQAALADMEPVELIFQAGSPNPEGHGAERDQAFADAIEEWSGGRITIDVVFGQAIAPHDEIVEATADGRIDIGYDIPIYNPSKYPAVNDLVSLAAEAPAGPYVPEIVNFAAALDVAWNNEAVLDDFRNKGVDVLFPAEFQFSNGVSCTEPSLGLKDLDEKMIRAGSATDLALIESVGASGVSLHLGELFEALERNLVHCASSSMGVAEATGILEAAPYVAFPNDLSWGRSSSAIVTGPGVKELPLAARQLIFDKLDVYIADGLSAQVRIAADTVDLAEQYGGNFERIEPEVDEALKDGLNDYYREGLSVLDLEDTRAQLQTALETWHSIADEEGLREVSDWEELATLVHDDAIDFDSYAQRIFEDIFLPHRPQ